MPANRLSVHSAHAVHHTLDRELAQRPFLRLSSQSEAQFVIGEKEVATDGPVRERLSKAKGQRESDGSGAGTGGAGDAPGAPAKCVLWESPRDLPSGAKKGELWHWHQTDLWESGFVPWDSWVSALPPEVTTRNS